MVTVKYLYKDQSGNIVEGTGLFRGFSGDTAAIELDNDEIIQVHRALIESQLFYTVKKALEPKVYEYSAMASIMVERKRQMDLWGSQHNNTPAEWCEVLGEEVGHVGKVVVESCVRYKDMREYREEMVHVAVVAIAAIESFDKDAVEG